jgi:hypothetical protein
MKEHILFILNYYFSIIAELSFTTEKVLQFVMQLESIYHRNHGFIEQKMSIN